MNGSNLGNSKIYPIGIHIQHGHIPGVHSPGLGWANMHSFLCCLWKNKVLIQSKNWVHHAFTVYLTWITLPSTSASLNTNCWTLSLLVSLSLNISLWTVLYCIVDNQFFLVVTYTYKTYSWTQPSITAPPPDCLSHARLFIYIYIVHTSLQFSLLSDTKLNFQPLNLRTAADHVTLGKHQILLGKDFTGHEFSLQWSLQEKFCILLLAFRWLTTACHWLSALAHSEGSWEGTPFYDVLMG